MFADSMILHAMTEAQSEQRESAAVAPQDGKNPGKESSMSTTQKQQEPQMRQDASQQSQQQGQTASHVQKDIQESAPARPYRDPLGRPLYQGNPRFTDQQAGGDLTGDESDARDDNYVETGSGQHARDVSAHAGKLPAASAELLRSISVSPTAEEVKEKARPQPAEQQPALEPEPDGSEDPGANADDGLAPRKTDGSSAEQH